MKWESEEGVAKHTRYLWHHIQVIYFNCILYDLDRFQIVCVFSPSIFFQFRVLMFLCGFFCCCYFCKPNVCIFPGKGIAVNFSCVCRLPHAGHACDWRMLQGQLGWGLLHRKSMQSLIHFTPLPLLHALTHPHIHSLYSSSRSSV